MKKYILLLTALLSLSGMAHATRTITAITVSQTEVKQSELFVNYIKISGSGTCKLQISYTGPSTATDYYTVDSTTAVNGYALVVSKSLGTPGNYKVKAEGDKRSNDGCAGSADATIHITRVAIKFGTSSAPMVCPTGYDLITGTTAGPSPKPFASCEKQEPNCPSGLFPNFNNQTGVLTCSANVGGTCAEGWIRADAKDQLGGRLVCKPKMPEIVCPPNFNAKFDAATNLLVCTPIITAPCPNGWAGSAADGKLVCNSKPQPIVTCPTNVDGSKYFKNGWNTMGCVVPEQAKIAN